MTKVKEKKENLEVQIEQKKAKIFDVIKILDLIKGEYKSTDDLRIKLLTELATMEQNELENKLQTDKEQVKES